MFKLSALQLRHLEILTNAYSLKQSTITIYRLIVRRDYILNLVVGLIWEGDNIEGGLYLEFYSSLK